MRAWISAIGLMVAAAGVALAAVQPKPDQAPATPKLDTTVRIDFAEPVSKAFLGIGVQWASYPWFEVSPADWEKVTRRVEFLRMPISRVMLDAFWYWRGFDAAAGRSSTGTRRTCASCTCCSISASATGRR